MLLRSLALAAAALLAAASAAATPAAPRSTHKVTVGLPIRPEAAERLERLFWEVSTPGSERYLQHASLEELKELLVTPKELQRLAGAWLEEHGARHVEVGALGTTISAEVPAPIAASDFPRTFDFVLHEALLPEDKQQQQQQHDRHHERTRVNAGFGGYKVNDIKKAYGIPTDLRANASTKQMVWGPGTFGYSKTQLAFFDFTNGVRPGPIQFDTENHGTSGGDNFGEGQLDVSMISSFGLGATTVVSNTNTSSSTEEGDGFGEALLLFLTGLAQRKAEDLPEILSISLGSLSPASCDLLCSEAVSKYQHTREECHEFMQQQRQVCMYLSQDQGKRIDVALQALGARGVSIFGSSGDGGSHFSFQKFDETSKIGRDLNEISCAHQLPVFPTSSPYVTSVGGEVWDGDDGSKPVAWSRGGGGFSRQFAMPEHQRAAVQAYLKAQGSDLPPSSSYNASMRAYPDLAGISQSGTSQSSPLVAGVFSLIADKRSAAGLKPLGFLGPRLYLAASAPAFTDITEGTTAFECSSGFSAASGWDPVTGLGRVNWSKLVELFASDDHLSQSEERVAVE